jgi:hypothetical protein
MDLVEVDAICLQTAQGFFRRTKDVTARIASVVGVFGERIKAFCRQDDLVAPSTGKRPADNAFAFALTITVGGIDDIDPGVESVMDDPGGRGFWCRVAEIPGT